MLDSLQHYISSKNLCTPEDRILLAVSGGIDSMVMLHLFRNLGVSFGVAHCNFQLRGKESDEDEIFVRTSVEMMGVPFYVTRFDTDAYAEENHLSVQMAARELRYAWFENVRKTNGYTTIATAHNANDSTETFFINLSRGCGLEGLTGIKPVSGNVIRPLLFASREQIAEYARRKGIAYREDSSNATDKYLRNYIRHNVIPVLNEAHSNFRKGIHTTIQNLTNSHKLYSHFLEKVRKEITTEKNNAVYIDLAGINDFPETTSLLWEILNPYGFNRDTCMEIVSSLHRQPGKIFLSSTHRVIKDRNHLIVTKLHPGENHPYYLEPDSIPSGLPFKIKMDVEEEVPANLVNKNQNMAILDFDLLEWPLILRKWKKGDYFAPLGMEGLKKVSDFLTDLKLSLYDKENAWLLESGNRIAWIIGRRIDHRFRIRENTRRILRVEVCDL